MKIIIVGAGTAGLTAALILKRKFLENFDIKIIKSKDIGIIGVGEGSTEHWSDFMGWCGLDTHWFLIFLVLSLIFLQIGDSFALIFLWSQLISKPI